MGVFSSRSGNGVVAVPDVDVHHRGRRSSNISVEWRGESVVYGQGGCALSGQENLERGGRNPGPAGHGGGNVAQAAMHPVS